MPETPSTGSVGYCAQCGAALRAGAGFCTACGAPAAPAAARPSTPARAAAFAPAGRSPRRTLWLALGAIVMLLALGAAALWALNRTQPGTSTAAATVPTVPVASRDIPYPDVARVAPEQAHISAMSGDALIVDVRGQEYYAQGHARGAISIPLEELPARLGELPKDKAILFYCT